MSDNCLFCKMVSGEIKPEVIFETPTVLAFKDNNPQAPLHALIIPKRHIATLNDLGPKDGELIGEMFLAAKQVAHNAGVADAGYRTVINCNGHGGQSVYHIHLHVIGGRPLRWPPG